MIDFIFELLSVSGFFLVGVGLGLVAALAAWFLLPATVDRVTLGAWLVGIGAVCGILYELLARKNK